MNGALCAALAIRDAGLDSVLVAPAACADALAMAPAGSVVTAAHLRDVIEHLRDGVPLLAPVANATIADTTGARGHDPLAHIAGQNTAKRALTIAAAGRHHLLMVGPPGTGKTMLAEEIALFVKTLEGITSTVTSDHIMNLLEDVSGKLPDDKEKMLAVIQSYQDLPETDRLIYRTGRRGGAYRSIDDLKHDPATYQKIKTLIQTLEQKEGPQGVEKMITEMVDRYI